MEGDLSRLISKKQKWQVRVKSAYLLATRAVSLSLSVPSNQQPNFQYQALSLLCADSVLFTSEETPSRLDSGLLQF